MPYSGVWLENKYDGVCSVPRAQRPERVKRHCEDQNEIYRFKPYLLQCNYRATGNFGMMATPLRVLLVRRTRGACENRVSAAAGSQSSAPLIPRRAHELSGDLAAGIG